MFDWSSRDLVSRVASFDWFVYWVCFVLWPPTSDRTHRPISNWRQNRPDYSLVLVSNERSQSRPWHHDNKTTLYRCNQSGASLQGTPGKPRWRSIIIRRRRHGTPPHPQRCRSEKSYGNIDHVFPSTATTISSHSNGNRNGRCSSEHKRSLFLTTADDAWRFLQGENKGMNSEVIFRM